MSSSESNNTPSPSSVPSNSLHGISTPTLSSSSVSTSSLSLPATTIKSEQGTLKIETVAKPSTPKPLTPPTSISEWQLLAVLQRANLVQYYDTFISQGGDDINQIMQCDESEFLEIMSLVGMLPKPLHVRRLQRALTEFSKDQASFNLAAIQQIGPPPVSPYTIGSADVSFLLPGLAATLTNLSSTSPGLATSTDSTSPSNGAAHNSVSLALDLSSHVLGSVASTGSIGATANVVRGELLQSIAGNGQPGSGATKEKERSSSPLSVGGDFVSLGDFDPNSACYESPVLSEAQIRRLSLCAQSVFQKIPQLPPKLIQNKKRISKEVLDLMSLPVKSPNRLDEYRKYSAIYGRFDTKRKPDKVLSLHEVSVNEAAAQLCLLMPSLLTRRDELFPLARQVVKDAGYHYAKTTRKRAFDLMETHSPNSSPSGSPPPGLAEEQDAEQTPNYRTTSAFTHLSEEKRRKAELAQEKGTYLERWATSKLASQIQTTFQTTNNDAAYPSGSH